MVGAPNGSNRARRARGSVCVPAVHGQVDDQRRDTTMQKAPMIDPRVRVVLTYLRGQTLDRRHTSLAHLARIAQRSPSRLMHVLAICRRPVGQYSLRLRLQHATWALAQCGSATDAAHIAWFCRRSARFQEARLWPSLAPISQHSASALLLDEIVVHLAPVLLGAGVRLTDGWGPWNGPPRANASGDFGSGDGSPVCRAAR